MNLKQKILSFLKQPYPFYYSGRNFLYFVIAIFILSFPFNYLLEPFNVYVPEHKMDYFWISLIHSFTPIVIAILAFPFLKSIKEENWTVGKEVLLVAVYLFLIGLVQFLIRDIIYDNPNNWSWNYFVEEIRNTFLVGTFMLSILISLNHNRLQYKNNKSASNLAPIHLDDRLQTTSISIKTTVKSDDFDLNITDFIYAKAEGNYVEIHSSNVASINTLLKRISIKELREQLKDLPNIYRTHRSYLVNLQCIEKVTGNAQGYRLQLKNSTEQVPVSRNSIPQFEKQLELLHKP